MGFITTPTRSSVALTTSSQVALPANGRRKAIFLFVDADPSVTAYFIMSAGSSDPGSTSDFSFSLPGGSTYERTGSPDMYSGAINVIGSSASGHIRITELT